MFRILSDYPWWAWLLCLLLGMLYAAGLYLRQKKWKPELNGAVYALAAVRWVAVTLLAMLLLEPFLRRSYNEEVKPVALVLQDNSASIQAGLIDSAAYLNAWSAFEEKVSKVYEVQRYSFGKSLEVNSNPDFSETETNLSNALNQIHQLYRFAHVGAVVLASDGIYNQGENPVYSHYSLQAPLHVVALGDTTPQQDVRIQRVLHNKLVYTGDQFTLDAEVLAGLGKGREVKVQLLEWQADRGVAKATQTFTCKSDREQIQAGFLLTANKPGLHHYKLTVEPWPGEKNTENNSYDVYVEVMDARQKILLVAAAPHPDIAAIQSALDANKNYEVEVVMASEYSNQVKGSSLVILHKLPAPVAGSREVIEDLKATEIPRFIITGQQPMWKELNSLQNLVTVEGGTAQGDLATASPNLGFSLFATDASQQQIWASYPPLLSPYATYSTGKQSVVLLYQKLGTVATQRPLWVFNQPGSVRTGVLLGENIWKWRLHTYMEQQNHRDFDDLIGKTVQYLAAKDDRKPFRLEAGKSVFTAQEKIYLDAELYNEAYERIVIPEVTCVIQSSDGTTYPYVMSKGNNRYYLEPGYLPAGTYSAVATVVYNQKKLTDDAVFTVAASQLEMAQTQANYPLLSRLSAEHGGHVFTPEQLDVLADSLLQSVWAKPLLREKVETRSFIHLGWLLGLLALLLAVEWLVRKWQGGY